MELITNDSKKRIKRDDVKGCPYCEKGLLRPVCDNYYKCPECGEYIKKVSVVS